ncbi:MAG: BlaI/MecI/CopY family transcriptional regulator [Lachnospiraceae bacterium]|nr:BlaI/MecI/CopY family transcriptional regulator [Lachnospiraceae bacterium]MBD5498192.1 BlaI/MecI/CopY family transcriptional regulator [Lachnospiraceae bacterium]
MNQREIDVLNVLWESDNAMSLADILSARPELIKSTVAATLAKLLKENLVEISGIAYSGKVLCRTYRPTPASKEKVLKTFTQEYNNIRCIIPPSVFLASILDPDNNPDTVKIEIAQIRAILDSFEKEHKLI